MRTKDENKVKAIKQAVIKLCEADGFTNLTTAKVAKQAGVSPATIYLYYKDKTDLLSRLYEEVKTDLHQGLAGVISEAGDDTTTQLRAMLTFSLNQTRSYPAESHFVSALWTNQELLDASAQASGNTEEGPLLMLYQRIQADPEFIDAPLSILSNFASIPQLITQTTPSEETDDATLNLAVDLVVKALRK